MGGVQVQVGVLTHVPEREGKGSLASFCRREMLSWSSIIVLDKTWRNSLQQPYKDLINSQF